MPIKGILFDKDGVLVDFDKTWVPVIKAVVADFAKGNSFLAQSLLLKAGYNAAEDIFFPDSIWAAGNANDLLEAWSTVIAEQGGAALSFDKLATSIERASLEAIPVPLLSLAEQSALLAMFKKQGYFLGIATNDSEASARHTFTSFGMMDYFDLIMGYDSVKNPKPAADPVLRFCKECNIIPSEVLMVGDSVVDAKSLRAAGSGVAIGVLSGTGSRESLEAITDFQLSSIAELPAWLNEHVQLMGTGH